MRISIVYSSLTGNTKKLADEIFHIMPEGTKIYDLNELNEELDDELLLLGYWVDKAKPNKEMYEFMKSLKGKKVITFGTLGAYPDSAHAEETRENTRKILEGDNEVLGNFLCQGKINPKITEMFKKSGGSNGVHKMDPERLKRHQEAAKHPNEEDFKNARDFVVGIIASLLSPVILKRS